jgi:hypothetical protein
MKLQKKDSVSKIQVGKTKIRPHPHAKEFVCKYSDVPTNAGGWVSDLRYYPINFDMMYVKVKERTMPIAAWWDGRRWKGLHLPNNSEITQWKRNNDCF